MKSLLGIKAKATQAVKERLDQAKSARSGEAVLKKPFEKQGASEEAGIQQQGEEPPDLHRSSKEQATPSNSRSSSPGKVAQAEDSKSSSVDPIILHLLQKARSEAVKMQFLRQPAEEYTATHNLKLLAGTYNVNGRLPPASLDLRPWLDVSDHPDLIAVAFQEIVPLNASNVVMGASLEAAGAWDRLIDAAINGSEQKEGHLIIRAASRKLGGAEPTFEVRHANPERSRSKLLALDALTTDAAAQPQHLLDSDAVLSQEGAQAHPMENGNHSRRTTEDTGGGEADEEGYLSPAEDTFSIFSDEQASAKPYVQVVGKQMVGVYLTVWARRALLKHIRGVQVTSIGTGIMGYLGNKGAVAARLRVFDSGLTLVSSHLSSGEQEGDELKRNYDYSEIVRRAAFPPDTPTLEPEALSSGPGAGGAKVVGAGRVPGQWGSQRGLLECEHVVWMGDLNYRLNMPDEEARAAIKAGKLDEVARNDELVNMMRQSRAFQGWQEGPLVFPPTFKFKRGTNTYLGEDEEDFASCQDSMPDLSELSVSTSSPSVIRSSPGQPEAGSQPEKRRTPAWTDRILWRPHSGIRQLSYSSASLMVSDHKPVIATFSIVAREYLRDRVEAGVDAARRLVDAQEMAAMPRCELEPLAVDAGEVYYAREKALHLILSNVGLVKARWEFMSLPGVMFNDPADSQSRPAPRWARISPSQGVLEPGEAAELQLRIWVDGGRDSTAELLTQANRKLDAILVLRIQDGNDIFCSVSGSFAPSFFGLPLTLLASLPRPLVPVQGWDAGSPKLRINTAKRPKPSHHRDHGSDLISADFYSPVSSFHDSPMSVAASSDHDFATARQRARSNRSSVGSDADFDAMFSGRPPAEGSTPLPTGPHHAPVPERITRPPGETTTGRDPQIASRMAADMAGRPPQNPANDAWLSLGEQAEGHDDGATLHESASVAALLPPELAALTSYLQEEGRLSTANLFLSSVDLAHAVSPRAVGAAPQKEEARAVNVIRESLDKGLGVPPITPAQDAAATVLAFFYALPTPFMPHAAAQVCDVCRPSRQAAASLLADALSPPEWAVFRHITGLARTMLEPHNQEANGLTLGALATLLAEVWFDRMPARLGGASHELRPQDVADLQRLADGVSEVAERRAAFVGLFLSPSEAEAPPVSLI